MDVQLYVYDLSRGIARQMSRQFLGIQIDAVYHTALVFGGIEYFFGAGVQTTYPGTTHHGQPMEILPMGRTDLPIEVILEYLESLKDVYTAESYDLFTHNCNNFTNDFATFLVGHGIPAHITSLPKTVLDTPFGQMLRPQLDSAMRGMTQAPVPPQSVITDQAKASTNGQRRVSNGVGASALKSKALSPNKSSGEVYNVTTLERLNQLLAQAKSSSAVIFFTSATCAPCRLVYPTYDQLAAETEGKCFLIKVDISQAHEIASKYSIRATPTFHSFLKGKSDLTWSGASPPQLQGNVRMLVESAFPPHPHQLLNLPTFRRQSTKPILYSKVPPLGKLQAKMGAMAQDKGITEAIAFIQQRNSTEATQNAAIPDMALVSASIEECLVKLPEETRFIAFDLLRLLLLDPRISGYYLSSSSTLQSIFSGISDNTSGPYNLRLCALHAACNIFTAQHNLLIDSGTLSNDPLISTWSSLLAPALLDQEHTTLRNAAGSLAFNLATAQMQARLAGYEAGTPGTVSALSPSTQVELAASLVEALSAEEESADAVKVMAIALARLVYFYIQDDSRDTEILDLCVAMDAGAVIKAKEKLTAKADRVLTHEIGVELLGKGVKSRR